MLEIKKVMSDPEERVLRNESSKARSGWLQNFTVFVNHSLLKDMGGVE